MPQFEAPLRGGGSAGKNFVFGGIYNKVLPLPEHLTPGAKVRSLITEETSVVKSIGPGQVFLEGYKKPFNPNSFVVVKDET